MRLPLPAPCRPIPYAAHLYRCHCRPLSPLSGITPLIGRPSIACRCIAHTVIHQGEGAVFACNGQSVSARSGCVKQFGNARSPFAKGGLQCEACHGPGALHAKNKKAAAINNFKRDSKVSLEDRNKICLSCHEGTTRTAWHAGAHERADLACTDCHKVHREHDPELKKATESQVCFTCHKQQRNDFLKTSAHPVRQGKMACSDCHNAHGSTSGAISRPCAPYQSNPACG